MQSVTASEIVAPSDEVRERQPDWTLDPSDPLNLLLNNSNDTDSELSQAATPPDWSQFTSLWHGLSADAKDGLPPSAENAKVSDLVAGFDFSFPMDLEFKDSSFSVAVDPNSLYLDGRGIQVPVHHAAPTQPQDLLAAPFPFTFSSPTLSSSSSSSPLTDESSRFCSPKSPGSFSSSTQSAASPVAPQAPKTTAEAIAAFFSQSRPSVQGLITSLPTQSITMPQQVQVDSHPSFPSVSPSPIAPASYTSGPSPPRAPEVPSNTATGRPKTSHTTIERRYRTNLNARIQSLKAAVPALRVLDQNYKNDEYKVDERGYIDGVKVARKGSKANVLGKAVEYIRVLKRREARLKREQDGLRALICGFSGGQSILSEWDVEWTKKFGGPERDEIDNPAVEELSDEDDGDGEGEDDDNSSERIRKKQKIDSAPPKKDKRKLAPAAPVPSDVHTEIVVTAPGVVPEKRKRGRPRKIQPNVPPPIVASAPVLLTDPSRPPQQGIAVPPMDSQPTHSQQYLLAVFALFSFFNSPLTSSPSPVTQHHTHEGSVLSYVGSSSTAPFTPDSGNMWKDLVSLVHLIASVLVIMSVILPWVPVPYKLSRARILQLIPFSSLVYGSCNLATGAHQVMDLPTPPASPDASDSDSEADSAWNDDTVDIGSHARVTNPLVTALCVRGSAHEFQSLLNALDVSGGLMGVLRCVVGVQAHAQNSLSRHEKQAWIRVAELIVLNPEVASLSLRWQVRNRLSSITGFRSSQAVSPTPISELCTLALLEYSLSLPYTKSRSQALWKCANDLAESESVPTFESLVFDTMSVDEAIDCLASSKHEAGLSPIELLASTILRRRLHTHLSMLFVHCVSESQNADSEFPSAEDSKEWQDTITFGRSLGGPLGLLAEAFAKVWKLVDIDIDNLVVGHVDEDIRALLSAVVLYRRIFTPRELLCQASDSGSADTVDFILSPPPSPTHSRDKQSKDMVLHLRRALGSSVFEQRDDTQMNEFSLEDARDRVVDMLVNLERGRRFR